MSAEQHARHDHGHDHGHDHHDDGHAHGTMGGYMIGFGLSVILTAIPFWLVMTGALGNAQLTGFVIMAFAVVQIVVHMIYFLHMSARSESGWTMMALIFTIVIVVITLSGSMWVMYHLNHNMMPVSAHDMSQMP
ncbi:cytochrome o ubiquinol oxidase subunit IV [Sphingobium phenoxybenzoativorans]|uniref:Cytochrome bo(3) ubiquinol oxidase subunit 4 n=1 Tax=Sphingobium phenoxybenzoativorans TaxID=1592790 RepID=A0A975KB85_9SPHN|nr:cytochrome o ubiquinol oxidase subunit IV [Sphingobium phenoxybenzoativorans]QUT07729.1 cytochrome o ubiquinol oxidase subunit IV [Sphingobium phenoxybenzoativorans]